MKQYNLSADLKPYILRIAERRNIPYFYSADKNESKISIDVSSNIFHRIIIRARMEKIQEDAGSEIPFVSEKELHDPIVRDEVGDIFILK